MVMMGVRDQHAVDVHHLGEVDRRHATLDVKEPAAQERVGEDANAVELDQDGRMPDVGESRDGLPQPAAERASGPAGSSSSMRVVAITRATIMYCPITIRSSTTSRAESNCDSCSSVPSEA
jgi:hypothetical protein